MAKSLAQAGAKVAVMDLSPDAAKRVADEINKAGGTAMPVKCNVLDKKQIEEAAKEIIAAFGKVDILINGAGGNKKDATTSDAMTFFDLPAEAIRGVFDLNFLGTLLPSQVFGKDMAKNGSGVILNVSSMNAFRPLKRVSEGCFVNDLLMVKDGYISEGTLFYYPPSLQSKGHCRKHS